MKILDIMPRAAIPGGEISIRWQCQEGLSYSRPVVRFDHVSGHLVSASADLIVVKVPEEAQSGDLWVSLNGRQTNKVFCEIGTLLAGDLHPVANPALDLEGNLYVTISGKRGEKVPHSVFKIDPSGQGKAFVSDLINATGMAFNSQGEMFVSSRHEGNIYRINSYGEKSVYAKGMGVATGIAFDMEDNLYVGDRTGTIFKIDRKREIFVFATLEPSVSAYHLAFDDNQNLFVSGPTTSSYEHIYKITSNGNVGVFFTGLGRPQGMAFDMEGSLYVAASLGGRRGIVRITRDKQASLVVAGYHLVGLAFGYHRELYVANSSSVYKLNFGTVGRPLP
ncbi:MAG: gluconolaconase [Acidobacteriota bacterium]